MEGFGKNNKRFSLLIFSTVSCIETSTLSQLLYTGRRQLELTESVANTLC
jgi:hypothetical protein